MVSHTWVIDTKTGRPFEERTSDFMENWGWSAGKSADQLADYMGFALKILKNAGFTCEGITTPGGFGNRVLPALAHGYARGLPRCRSKPRFPHYFRHLFTDGTALRRGSSWPRAWTVPIPRCVVSMIGCTGDWFGGWDGLTPGSVDQFITADLKRGRLPEVIARGEPAILVCHWPGMYFNGQETGFKIFQEVVKRLDQAYDHLDLDEAQRDRAILGCTRADPDRAPGRRLAQLSRPLCVPAVYGEARLRRPDRCGLESCAAESRGESN